MKKLLFGSMLLALVIAVPIPMMADVNISIGIPLPPVITFTMAPEVIVIPGTYVYVIPDMDVRFNTSSAWTCASSSINQRTATDASTIQIIPDIPSVAAIC